LAAQRCDRLQRQSNFRGRLDNTTKGTAGGGGWADTGDAFNILPPYQKGNGVCSTIPYRLVPIFPSIPIPDVPWVPDIPEWHLSYRLRNGTGGTSCASPRLRDACRLRAKQIIAGGGLPANSWVIVALDDSEPALFLQRAILPSSTSSSLELTEPLPNGAVSVATPGWDTASGWGAVICGRRLFESCFEHP